MERVCCDCSCVFICELIICVLLLRRVMLSQFTH